MSAIVYPVNGVEYDASMAETHLCTRTTGLLDMNQFNISKGTETAGMFNITPGYAWVKLNEYSGKSICIKETNTVYASSPVKGVSIYDYVIMRYDEQTRRVTFRIENSASKDVVPVIVRDNTICEFALYMIEVNGSKVLPSGDIQAVYTVTDLRKDESKCGMMRDMVLPAGIESLLLDKLYPVGAIYMSVSSTSPATFLGGKWTKIEGRYILASGEDPAHPSPGVNYKAGASGGSFLITLQEKNLPPHTHPIPAHTHTVGSHTHSIPALTVNVSASGAHTHDLENVPSVTGMTKGTDSGEHFIAGSYATKTKSAGSHTHTGKTVAGNTGAGTGNTGATALTANAKSQSYSAVRFEPSYFAVNVWRRTE